MRARVRVRVRVRNHPSLSTAAVHAQRPVRTQPALAWALRDLGIMLGTDGFFTQSLTTGALVRALPEWHQPADVWAVSAGRGAQSAKVRAFIEGLRGK
ncbi:MAG: hypothetical protein RIQ60_2410 [Pseudomonadota bacterium]|jgi:DNA-binding transcriptional LysR family regulator